MTITKQNKKKITEKSDGNIFKHNYGFKLFIHVSGSCNAKVNNGKLWEGVRLDRVAKCKFMLPGNRYLNNASVYIALIPIHVLLLCK